MILTDKKMDLYVRDILMICQKSKDRINWRSICDKENAEVINEAIMKTTKSLSRIDRIMSTLQVGDIFYYEDIDVSELNWFRFQVDQIVSRELGIVRGHEPDSFHPSQKELSLERLFTKEEYDLNKQIY